MTETSGYFISVLGVITGETGITLKDDDGNEYPEMEEIQGYHANLRCNDAELLEGIQQLVIDVDSPSNVIA